MRPIDAADPRYQRPQAPRRRALSTRIALGTLRHYGSYWEYYLLAFVVLTVGQAVWPSPTWWIWPLAVVAALALWWLRPRWRGGFRNVERIGPMYDTDVAPEVGNKLVNDPAIRGLYNEVVRGWVNACKFVGDPLATRDQYALHAAQSRRMALAGVPGMPGLFGKALSAVRLASTARMALVEQGYQIVPVKDAVVRPTGVALGVDAALVPLDAADKVAPLLAQFFRVPGGCRVRYNQQDALDGTIWFEFIQIDSLARVGPAVPPHVLVPADTDIPIGVAATGQPVVLNFADQAGHLALQGVTRSGKSVLTYNVLAWAAHMPAVHIWGNDHTNILLGPLGALPGRRAVGPDMEEHAATMQAALAEMDRRIAELVNQGLDKFSDFSTDMPVLLYVLEEFPGLIRAAQAHDKAVGAKPAERLAPILEAGLARLVAEGAKVGVRVFLIAQRASANVVDTDSRSNFVARITLRMDNAEGVRMLHSDADPEMSARAKDFKNGRGYFESPWIPFTEWQAAYLGEYSTDYVPAVRRALQLRGEGNVPHAPQAQP